MGENGDEVLSAKQYANMYGEIPEPSLLCLDDVPVMTEATICEIWPSSHTRIGGSFLAGETGRRDDANQGGSTTSTTGEVQSLRELSVKRLVSSSFEQDDNSWLNCRDLDIFPDLPPAIFSHVITQGEKGIDVMRKSSSAAKLVSFAFNALHKHQRIDILNMSTLPFSTMTAKHIASVLKSFFAGSWDGFVQGYTIKELNLSSNPNLTRACVQHILSAIPNHITIEKLIIVNLPTFQPHGLLLPPRSILSPPTTYPDILTVQSLALSTLALPPLDLSAHTGDFMPIIPHPFGPASPNSVSSAVICFPVPSSTNGFEGHAVPIHVPFNFAHPRPAAAALIQFIWCLANTGTGDFHEYPEIVVKIFGQCNPVNILQVWGIGKFRTYDYYHRFNEWSEKRRGEKMTILQSVLENARDTKSWTVFVSAVPSLYNVNAADVKIRYAFVRESEGKLVIASIPELIATCVKPGPEGRPCGMEDVTLSDEARRMWETQISQGFVKGCFGKLQVRLFAEEEIWGSG
ncbi:hypothetical protein K440DRAFT_625413 [Wilcoxina mikolae CBS 423.85]|nr:hypothetical protein K440DRAFT_625413 [Wilcoxina mikolae CBS 423.85]